MKYPVVLSLIVLLVAGCTEAEKFWNKEFVQVYAPAKIREQDRGRTGESLDYFIGRSKDERIRIIGNPDGCTMLTNGDEMCEWRPKASNALEQHVVYTYDRNGIARTWSYRGPLGQFTSDDYKSGGKSTVSVQPSETEKKGWFHPAKGVDASSSEFSRDYFACQNSTAKDSKSKQGMAMHEEYWVEGCMKENGWVHK